MIVFTIVALALLLAPCQSIRLGGGVYVEETQVLVAKSSNMVESQAFALMGNDDSPRSTLIVDQNEFESFVEQLQLNEKVDEIGSQVKEMYSKILNSPTFKERIQDPKAIGQIAAAAAHATDAIAAAVESGDTNAIITTSISSVGSILMAVPSGYTQVIGGLMILGSSIAGLFLSKKSSTVPSPPTLKQIINAVEEVVERVTSRVVNTELWVLEAERYKKDVKTFSEKISLAFEDLHEVDDVYDESQIRGFLGDFEEDYPKMKAAGSLALDMYNHAHLAVGNWQKMNEHGARQCYNGCDLFLVSMDEWLERNARQARGERREFPNRGFQICNSVSPADKFDCEQRLYNFEQCNKDFLNGQAHMSAVATVLFHAQVLTSKIQLLTFRYYATFLRLGVNKDSATIRKFRKAKNIMDDEPLIDWFSRRSKRDFFMSLLSFKAAEYTIDAVCPPPTESWLESIGYDPTTRLPIGLGESNPAPFLAATSRRGDRPGFVNYRYFLPPNAAALELQEAIGSDASCGGVSKCTNGFSCIAGKCTKTGKDCDPFFSSGSRCWNPSGDRCGSDVGLFCASNMCCSRVGWCGSSPDYCRDGKQSLTHIMPNVGNDPYDFYRNSGMRAVPERSKVFLTSDYASDPVKGLTTRENYRVEQIHVLIRDGFITKLAWQLMNGVWYSLDAGSNEKATKCELQGNLKDITLHVEKKTGCLVSISSETKSCSATEYPVLFPSIKSSDYEGSLIGFNAVFPKTDDPSYWISNVQYRSGCMIVGFDFAVKK